MAHGESDFIFFFIDIALICRHYHITRSNRQLEYKKGKICDYHCVNVGLILLSDRSSYQPRDHQWVLTYAY